MWILAKYTNGFKPVGAYQLTIWYKITDSALPFIDSAQALKESMLVNNRHIPYTVGAFMPFANE